MAVTPGTWLHEFTRASRLNRDPHRKAFWEPRNSITSSQRRRDFESSIVAVCELMTSANLVDCMTGKSAVFTPFRMRPA
jgi:hypothetical protein